MSLFQSDSTLAELLELVPSSRVRQRLTKFLYGLRSYEYFWDPWLFKDRDIYRLFYLKAPKPEPSTNFWSQGTVYEATSKDLQNWDLLGVALAPEPSNSWESGRILAGSTYKENDLYYLFYSASGGGESLKDERIGLATSIDGLSWQRYSTDYFFSEAEWNQWYGRQADTGHFHWRDPYVVRERETGKYYMFICTHQKHSTDSRFYGCVGVAVSSSLAGPYKLLPPVAGAGISGLEDWPFTEMERPQIIYRHGKYHLFFSCWPWNLNPAWLNKVGRQSIRESSLYWFTSDKITGPYQPVSACPVVKGSNRTGMYATNLFAVQEQPDEYIAIGWYHRIYTLQVSQQYKVKFEPHVLEM
jgi:beta-fructofuranosidase